MMGTGLSEAEWSQIQTVFARHPEVTGVILFGSRAQGTAAPESDIDLAVEGSEGPLKAAALASELDDLPLPYRFDVQSLEAIRSPTLREHIAKAGIRVYG